MKAAARQYHDSAMRLLQTVSDQTTDSGLLEDCEKYRALAEKVCHAKSVHNDDIDSMNDLVFRGNISSECAATVVLILAKNSDTEGGK